MGREIIVAFLVSRPIGVLTDDLSAQLVRDSKPFDWPQPCDPRRPKRVLRFTRSGPIARHVALNLSRDHRIYSSPCHSRRRGGAQAGPCHGHPPWLRAAKLLLELVELMGIEPMTS